MIDIKELDIKAIKQIENELLVFFADYCEKHNISFFLSNGTLLGAVKYKGFIPWDDDIDVIVPRRDYDRLNDEFQNTDRFTLFSHERDEKYLFPYIKLCDNNTLKDEKIGAFGTLGLAIDVFPLDGFDLSERKVKRIVKKQHLLNVGLMLANTSDTAGKSFLKKVIYKAAGFIGPRFFCNRMIRLVSKHQSETPRFSGCFSWPIYGEREIVSSDVFADSQEVCFEGRAYHAPIGFDIYLRSLYGDYMKDPPVDKQCTHHRFTAYKK